MRIDFTSFSAFFMAPSLPWLSDSGGDPGGSEAELVVCEGWYSWYKRFLSFSSRVFIVLSANSSLGGPSPSDSPGCRGGAFWGWWVGLWGWWVGLWADWWSSEADGWGSEAVIGRCWPKPVEVGVAKGWSKHHGRSLGLADGRLGAAAVKRPAAEGPPLLSEQRSPVKREAQWGSMGLSGTTATQAAWGPSADRSNLREGCLWHRWLFSAEVWLWLCSNPVFGCRRALWVWRDTVIVLRWSFVSMFSRDVMILSTLCITIAKLSCIIVVTWRYWNNRSSGQKV